MERNLQNSYEGLCTRESFEMASELGNGMRKMGNMEY